MIAILAIDDGLGFGKGKGLPWPRIQEDMEHFVRQTKNSKIIMGRKTYETLPFGPTDSRPFHVLTTRVETSEDPNLVFSNKLPEYGVIIGGASLLNHTAFLSKCSEVYVTRVKGVFPADTKLHQETLDYLEAHFAKIKISSSDNCTIWNYYR